MSVTPRRLAIAGAHNLRDLGGYAAAGGGVIKWRRLYRSGAIRGLDADGLAAMRALGLAAIYDLRTAHERARDPMDWHDAALVSYVFATETASAARLEQVRPAAGALAAQMRERMHGIYRRLPFEQAQNYRALFAMLRAGRLPLLFNCSAGKDRTGLAAALLLTALGVPRETVIEDYLLSNATADALGAMMAARSPRYAGLLAADPLALKPVLQADAAYLDTAFAEITRRCGDFEGYFSRHLGIGADALAELRRHLLE